MKRKRRKKSNIQNKKTKNKNPKLELIELSPFVKDFEIIGH